MDLETINFLVDYENKVQVLQILEILKNNLTTKGDKTYGEIKSYLQQNLDKYLINSTKSL